jgi:formate dehydrogenase assembly factor FdhD
MTNLNRAIKSVTRKCKSKYYSKISDTIESRMLHHQFDGDHMMRSPGHSIDLGLGYMLENAKKHQSDIYEEDMSDDRCYIELSKLVKPSPKKVDGLEDEIMV